MATTCKTLSDFQNNKWISVNTLSSLWTHGGITMKNKNTLTPDKMYQFNTYLTSSLPGTTEIKRKFSINNWNLGTLH